MKAPKFTLKNQHGEDVTLPSNGIDVLFFYPKANTPGCTIESKKFSEINKEFEKAGATVYGISPDPHDKVCKFAEKYDMAQNMLADEDHSVAETYGVWQKKKFMGKEYMGIVRTTIVVQNGNIVEQFKHKPGKTEEEVLAFVKELA